MSKEEIVNTEKFIIRMLEHSIDTYIEDTKVAKIELTTEQAQVLLDLYNKQKKEIEYLKSQIPADKIFYYSDKDYISKDKIRDKIKKLEYTYQREEEENGYNDETYMYYIPQIKVLKEMLGEL